MKELAIAVIVNSFFLCQNINPRLPLLEAGDCFALLRCGICFLFCKEGGAEVALAGVGEKNDDVLAGKLRTLGNL